MGCKPMELIKGLQWWCKKHEPWLSYASLIIICVTIFSREMLPKYWRDIAATIDTAEYMYSIKIDMSAEEPRFNDVMTLLVELQKVIKSPREVDPEERERHFLSMIDGWNQKSLATLGATLNNIEILTDKIKDDELTAKLNNFRNETTKAHGELDAIQKADQKSRLKTLSGIDIQYAIGWWTYSSRAHKILKMDFWIGEMGGVDRGQAMQLSLAALKADVIDFDKEVVEKGKQIKETNEARSRRAWWISGILFGASCFLGLIGKIFKLKGVEHMG